MTMTEEELNKQIRREFMAIINFAETFVSTNVAMQDRLATLGQAKWVYDLCQSAGIAPTPLVRREATGRDDVVTESEGE